ncbi:hypothetical protein DXT63_04615 [Thermoanaerobacteraceae bacterium SP2]|nr:hypothetical protein DXT63_04615 [Thermoanaerobacteraceae bacterium SP2]
MKDSTLSVVISRLEAESKNIDRLRETLEKRDLLDNDKNLNIKLSDDFTLRAVGSIFHDFYTSVENMFKIVGRYVDKSMPEGPDWHLELLQQMATPIINLRGPVISLETKELLNEFRGFRHVFRNVYGFNLIGQRLEGLLKIFPTTLGKLKNDIRCFINEMNEL